MLDEGHIKKVDVGTEELDGREDRPIHYLTDFATGQAKFRVVYNGALQINNVSINDLLHRGPMFLEPLVTILLRFRQYKYAVTGDIKNMFFQIRLHPKD